LAATAGGPLSPLPDELSDPDSLPLEDASSSVADDGSLHLFSGSSSALYLGARFTTFLEIFFVSAFSSTVLPPLSPLSLLAEPLPLPLELLSEPLSEPLLEPLLLEDESLLVAGEGHVR